jgi:hypothetical protein
MISLTAEGHTVKMRNLWLTLFISSLYLSQIKKKLSICSRRPRKALPRRQERCLVRLRTMAQCGVRWPARLASPHEWRGAAARLMRPTGGAVFQLRIDRGTGELIAAGLFDLLAEHAPARRWISHAKYCADPSLQYNGATPSISTSEHGTWPSSREVTTCPSSGRGGVFADAC